MAKLVTEDKLGIIRDFGETHDSAPSTDQRPETYWQVLSGSRIIRIHCQDDTSKLVLFVLMFAGLTMWNSYERCPTTSAPTAMARVACTRLRV
jgi:hypothetical protein